MAMSIAAAISPPQPSVNAPHDYPRAQQSRARANSAKVKFDPDARERGDHMAGPSRTARNGPKGVSAEKASPEKKAARGRQNSLRRAKNSADMLRERSLQRQRSKKEKGPDNGSAGREGKARQFTVANVGNNGMIYLRSVRVCLWTCLGSGSYLLARACPPKSLALLTKSPQTREAPSTAASPAESALYISTLAGRNGGLAALFRCACEVRAAGAR